MPLLASVIFSFASAGGWDLALEAAGYDSSEFTLLEGAAGATDTGRRVKVRSVVDDHEPRVEIVWKRPMEVPVFELPKSARVFARDRASGAPMTAAWVEQGRTTLWTAVSPGASGYDRFPFLPHALHSLGAKPRFESRGLWVFFDPAYRVRADLDYLAARWREGGVSAIHVTAWKYWEPDPAADAWLSKLIETCHRNAILVYAWLELPHVSQRFWEDHPEWREKTATGQDAVLDWRQLMDLTHPDCDRAVRTGLASLMERFDWDGVNLAELYFESLEGAANPARFTPFAPHVRQLMRQRLGIDPLAALKKESRLLPLLEVRADLAAELQQRWLNVLKEEQQRKPHLDLVLTHIDDRLDVSMRHKLGADAARLLPEAARAGATFMIEDPATLWHLDAGRYAAIARQYAKLGAPEGSLAIDLNIVERYQEVYPTKQQAGVELFQLVRTAARHFPRVALYFENSILRSDWPLLAAAATPGVHRLTDGRWEITSPHGVWMRHKGPVRLNGGAWPVFDGTRVYLPAGIHTVEPSADLPPTRLADFQGNLRKVQVIGRDLKVTYESKTRAIAVLANENGRVHRMLPAGKRTILLSMED